MLNNMTQGAEAFKPDSESEEKRATVSSLFGKLIPCGRSTLALWPKQLGLLCRPKR